MKGKTREAKDLLAKAKAIEDAVYDLKAVTPHKKSEVDTRTPEVIVTLIEAKGRETSEALGILRGGSKVTRGVGPFAP